MNIRVDDLMIALERLYSVVAEQQYALESLGWIEDNDIVYSKAGARKHQFEAVSLAVKDALEVLEGRSAESELIKKLLEIKDKARRACSIGHSNGCKCWCCEVVSLCDKKD